MRQYFPRKRPVFQYVETVRDTFRARASDEGDDDSWRGKAAAPLEPERDEEPKTRVSGTMPVARHVDGTSSGVVTNMVSGRVASLPDLQRDVILRAFEDSRHTLSQAAQDLGIPRSTLRARLRRYGVR